MSKPDDSSLTDEQAAAVRRAAVELLNEGSGWDRLPTPVSDLLDAAKLRTAPMSAFDHGLIERYARQFGGMAKRFLKAALDKVLGVLDVIGNIVHVDPSVSKEKQNFLKLHETGHSQLPHQRGVFRWIQECRKTLDPETSDLFEREANNFASIVLFQDTRFAAMTADSAFGIRVPLAVGRRFGASAYASIREYVRKSTKACAVVVLDPPQICAEKGLTASVRRIGLSPEFVRRFGNLTLPDNVTDETALAPFIPVGGRRMSRPGTFSLQDRNGISHEFIGEGFGTPYNVFILLHASATLNKATIILPAAFQPRTPDDRLV